MDQTGERVGALVIVVDTNVLVYRFLEGLKTPLARQVSERDDDWHVPSLWRHEFANALAMAVRAGGLEIDAARKVYRESDSLLAARERHVDLDQALQLSTTHAISVYDAEYVSLARSLGIMLITEDKELLRKFPDTAMSMRKFIDAT